MKIKNYKDHVKTYRDQEGILVLKICDKGLNCPVCYEVLDRVIKKELQSYTEERFTSGNQYLLSMEWMIPLSYVELDPHLLDNLENRIKNFLEKNDKMDALYRLDLHLDLSSISVSLLLISPRATSLKVATEAFKDWTIFYPSEVYYRDGEWVDNYEFYVWAVPFSYGKEELDFISQLSDDSKLRTRLENRVVIIEGDKPL